MKLKHFIKLVGIYDLEGWVYSCGLSPFKITDKRYWNRKILFIMIDDKYIATKARRYDKVIRPDKE